MNESTINAVMKQLAKGQVSRAAAAERLGVNVRTINRWMKKRGVERPRSRHSIEMEGREARRKVKVDYANSVIAGHNTLQGAAQTAGVTLRTMERWVEKAVNEAEKAQKHAKNASKSRKRRTVT